MVVGNDDRRRAASAPLFRANLDTAKSQRPAQDCGKSVRRLKDKKAFRRCQIQQVLVSAHNHLHTRCYSTSQYCIVIRIIMYNHANRRRFNNRRQTSVANGQLCDGGICERKTGNELGAALNILKLIEQGLACK